MTIKGYPDEKKLDTSKVKYATVGRVGSQQCGVDTRTWAYYEATTDAVEATSTATRIKATAHAVRVGDLISFSSGTYSGYEVHVERIVDADNFDLEHELPGDPSAADAFSVLRRKAQKLNSDGTISASFTIDKGGGAIGADTTRTTEAGKAYADSVRYDHSTPVTTGAWTQLIAATAAAINALMIFDSSGEVLELGVGAAASESRVLLIPPGGIDGVIPFRIAAGARVSVRAVSANTAGGQLVLQGLT